ncbi:MAG: ornithine--oxo-acid transaminase, partial [Catenulispora sp.]|nr:ornithine--oxo-acid transaminase [Catenulispora sp.]
MAPGGGTAPRVPASAKAEALIEQSDAHTAHNYHPLPVVIAEADGAWVTDV